MYKFFATLFTTLTLLWGHSYAFAQTTLWAQTGLTNVRVNALALNSKGTIFGGTEHGVFRSSDDGDNWMQMNTGLTNLSVRSLAIDSNEYVFVGTWGDGGIFRSSDNGNSWAQIDTGLPDHHVLSLALNANDQVFAGTWYGGVCRSTDHGNSWTQVSIGATGSTVWSLAIDARGQVFSGTDDCDTRCTGGGSISRSTNNGNTWMTIALKTGNFPDTAVLALATIPDGHVFAGTRGGGIFRSTDYGVNWTEASVGLTNPYVLALAISSKDNIFAGTAGGVFRSTNNGDTWTAANSGLTDTVVVSLAVNRDGFVFAATEHGGVFRTVQPTTTVREISMELPAAFGLEQNYPNPFNPSTRIAFTVHAPGFTTLKVFDLLGREVATLASEEMEPGTYEVEWIADNLASGTYFYQLHAGSYAETKKLILMK